MKKLIFLLGFLVAVAGCGKKSTGPGDGTTDDYSLQATQTIGSDGGTLEVEDFKLAVPQGAFDAGTELKLYASSEDQPFGDNGVSRTFRLEGLPDEYSQPLKVSIEYEETLSDSSFIAVGEEAMVASSGELETAYELLSATDSAGYLHCELPASEGGKAAPRANYPFTISGSDKGRKLLVASKYFIRLFGYLDYYYSIYVPSGTAVSITDLADFLDEANLTFQRMGYHWFFPPDVIVRDLGTDDYCKFKYRNRDQYEYLEINTQKMTPADFPKLRMMIGREVYRCILFDESYDPHCPVMVGPAHQDYYWLNQAAVSWCEEKFVPEEEQKNYIPICFPGNEMAPFNGMHAGIKVGEGDAARKARNHGCGMSAMIKYLVDRFDDPNDRRSVIHHIHMGLGILYEYHPVKAVIAGTAEKAPEDPVNNWWWDFLKKYVEGGILQEVITVKRLDLKKVKCL